MAKLPALLLVLSLAVATAATACKSGSSGSKTPTATASRATPSATTATPAGSATSALGIRTIDVSKVDDVRAALQALGGEIAPHTVLYADLTGDGAEEAIVPISSGGTLGDVGFVVLTPAGGGTKTLLKEVPTDGHGMSVTVDGANLVVTVAVPGPDDPNCCPSFLRKTIYAWNGTALAIESETTEPNPGAGTKGTSVPGTGASTPVATPRRPAASP
jgi:hypothetical protein